jgi:hypothetical protein
MTLGSAAHKIPLEVAHTLVEIAEVARYAYHHRPGHHVANDGDLTTPPAGNDCVGGASDEAARLREENAMLRARLADDLALLRELHGAPCVSKECPPDVSVLYYAVAFSTEIGSLALSYMAIVTKTCTSVI